jgi:predicted phage-related endonuclease
VNNVTGPSTWKRGLECKNRDSRVAYLWGDSGTDEIPDDVAAQCHWSMAVTGLKRWDCAALIGGNDFRVYTIHWNEDIASDFIAIAHEFWHKNVLGGVEPPITGPSARDYLKQKFAKHGAEIITATPDVESLLESYGVFKGRIKELQKAVDATELQLQEAVGNAAGVKGKAGVYTWKTTSSGGTDWKGLASAFNPNSEMVAQYERPGFRKGLWTPTKEKR